ncbi:MAG: transposase [Planctomycetota bacterium]
MTIANEPKQIAQWLRKAKRRKGILVVMEATGGYEQILVDLLHEAQVDVAVCNPYQVRVFARGIGIFEKNDPIDAAVIARFGQIAEPKLRKSPTESERKLKALVHRWEQVLNCPKSARYLEGRWPGW